MTTWVVLALIVGLVFTVIYLRERARAHELRGAAIHDPARLAATFEYLQSNPIFDYLVADAARALNVAVCEFNVVTNERQFHVGKYPAEGDRSDPLVDSGCRFVVMKGKPVSVNNCVTDEDFMSLAGVRNGVFASYLGVPLRYKGELVGSFCVADTQVREWSKRDLDKLRFFAAQTGLTHD